MDGGIAGTAAENKPCWPDSLERAARWTAAMASSTEASISSLLPKESTAPDLMRLSNTRLFRKRGSMRPQNS